MYDDDIFNPLNVRRMDRTSVSTAASRQKSCNACVRGKRRCDKTMPRCTRCAAKGLDCEYQKVRKLPPTPPQGSSSPSSSSSVSFCPKAAAAAQAQQRAQEEQAQSDAQFDAQNDTQAHTQDAADVHHFHDQNSFGMTGGFDVGGFDLSGCDLGMETSTSTNTTSPETLQLDPNLDFNIADLINGHQTSISSGSSIWTLPDFMEPKNNFPAPISIPFTSRQDDIATRRPIRDLSALSAMSDDDCMSIDPLLVYDKRSRVGFVVDYITNLHSTFSKTRALPFIHPRLYATHVPRTMMTMFSALCAYSNRTSSTKAWAIRLINEAVKEVQYEGRNGPQTMLDKLSRLQALCLLESVRIFDGDISMRHAAEKEMNLLIEWLGELVKACDKMEDGETLSKISRDKPPKTWEHWITLESARRTNIMCMSMLCLFHVLKGEVPQIDMWHEDRGFTASKHLWEAKTSLDFFRAWSEKPQWGVTNCSFHEFWQYARAEDCDDFTKLMLTTQVGPDAIDHFMTGEFTFPLAA